MHRSSGSSFGIARRRIGRDRRGRRQAQMKSSRSDDLPICLSDDHSGCCHFGLGGLGVVQRTRVADYLPEKMSTLEECARCRIIQTQTSTLRCPSRACRPAAWAWIRRPNRDLSTPGGNSNSTTDHTTSCLGIGIPSESKPEEATSGAASTPRWGNQGERPRYPTTRRSTNALKSDSSQGRTDGSIGSP